MAGPPPVSLSPVSSPVSLSVSTTLPNGMTVGLTDPWFLLALPVALVAVVWLVLRGRGTASTRSRRLLVLSRVLVVVLLVGAAAGPYTVETKRTPGEPRVTLLVDRSDSTSVSPSVADGLESAIENQGVPVTVATVGEGTNSRLGDGVLANLRENGSIVLLSDGHVTGGRTLSEAAEVANSLNATISSVTVEPEETERYVTLSGPAKTTVGVNSTFLASVDGVNTGADGDGGGEGGGAVTLTVTVDGEEVASEAIAGGNGSIEVTHRFESVGSHRVVARVTGSDRFEANDVYYKSVRVVERPRVLYVSRGEYPFREYLSQLYDVETAESVPADLDDYYAVVLQDLPASDVGDLDALQEFVIDGNGLLVVGGDNAFENGGYGESAFATMLPVTVGESAGGSSTIVFAIDVSGSAEEGMRVQKALALDALDQLDDENEVGIVGFNYQAYAVAEPVPLKGNRAELQDKIRRLQSGGATSIAAGLRGAAQMLGDRRGTVILISDGRARVGETAAAASTLGRNGIQVVAIGAGPRPREDVLRTVAQESGGSYFRATETNRLRILFGGSSRQFEGEGLTIVDANSFITSGVTLESNPASNNDVSVKRGAEFLVASGSGEPAVASWRYGLGRVVTITAYGSDGTLDGLLRQPDSLLLTKATNFAIGDPERKRSGVADVPDTRVGEPTTVTFTGPERPSSDLEFRQVGPTTYRASVTPTEQGFGSALNAEYAVNYAREYGGFGRSPALGAAVRATDGRQFGPRQAGDIARFAREQAAGIHEVRQDWTWLLLLAGLLIYLAEVFTRRINVYTGRTRSDGGLT